jgi:hypothetical protein
VSESAHGAAARHLGRAPRTPHAHAKTLLRDNVDALGAAVDALLEPTSASVAALGTIVADEVRRRGLQQPRDIWRTFKILALRAAEEDRWVPGLAVKLSKDPRWSYLYRRVRLRCDWCTGYLVVRKRHDRRYRFAGCSNYTATGCRFTMASRAYARIKCEVVAALLTDNAPEYAYVEVEAKARPANVRRKHESPTR